MGRRTQRRTTLRGLTPLVTPTRTKHWPDITKGRAVKIEQNEIGLTAHELYLLHKPQIEAERRNIRRDIRQRKIRRLYSMVPLLMIAAMASPAFAWSFKIVWLPMWLIGLPVVNIPVVLPEP